MIWINLSRQASENESRARHPGHDPARPQRSRPLRESARKLVPIWHAPTWSWLLRPVKQPHGGPLRLAAPPLGCRVLIPDAVAGRRRGTPAGSIRLVRHPNWLASQAIEGCPPAGRNDPLARHSSSNEVQNAHSAPAITPGAITGGADGVRVPDARLKWPTRVFPIRLSCCCL